MINLGLTRITALVAKLPTTQTWKAVHIAGTNGKGSVAAYLSSLFLRLSKPVDYRAELKVGRFTSPHLIDRWDCITINDKPVSEALFLEVEEQVKHYASEVATEIQNKTLEDDDGNEISRSKLEENATVTEFELLTATAFEIFSQQNCQVAIIECGLGGRLDATNVLKPRHVACTVITQIGMDHIGVLGDTVEAIAREKAGIAKRNIPMVVDGSNQYSVVDAIAVIANSRNVAPNLSRRHEIEDQWGIARDQGIGALPPHQYNNLVLALSAFTHSQRNLPDLEFTTPSRIHLPAVLFDVRTSYPARLQHLNITSLFPEYPNPILLDGAHNPQSATVLKSYLNGLPSATTASSPTTSPKASFFRLSRRVKPGNPNPRTWILGMSKGKDLSQILNAVLEKGDNVVTCPFGRVDGMPWVSAMSPILLAREAERVVGDEGSVKIAKDIVDALSIAIEICGVSVSRTGASVGSSQTGSGSSTSLSAARNEIEIVVAGSLYLASDLLRAMRDGPDAVRERFDIGSAI